MSIDPMAALLQDNNDRISAAERLPPRDRRTNQDFHPVHSGNKSGCFGTFRDTIGLTCLCTFLQ